MCTVLSVRKKGVIQGHDRFVPKGWILLNVETVPKILPYLITSKLLLSNVRFSASFGRLEESTHPFKLKCNFETLCSSINML